MKDKRDSYTGINEEHVSVLREQGMIQVNSAILQDIKKHYKQGEMGFHVFEPPKIGSQILLLEHHVTSRDSINTRFKNERGFEREWTIYEVRKPVLYNGEPCHPLNKTVLSYSVMNGPRRERWVDYRDFYSGYYYPKVLTPDEVEIVQRYREIIDEKFDIRII